jgi:hypothetical protein
MNEYEFKAYCEEIRKTHKITDYIETVGLQIVHKGGKMWLSCPFHNEKTPSLTINEDDGTPFFHCFGCGAGGSIIDFVKRYENISVGAAIKKLGSGVDVDYDIDRLFKEHETSLEETVESQLLYLNGYISKACFNYMREIKDLVPGNVYSEEFDKMNAFYEKLDNYIIEEDLESVQKMEKIICYGDFIVNKVKEFEVYKKDED